MTERIGQATLEVTDRLVGAVPVRRFVVDCPHGTTTGDAINRTDEVDIVAILASRHEAAERCGCATYLLADGARA